jgi:hypothetical protein
MRLASRTFDFSKRCWSAHAAGRLIAYLFWLFAPDRSTFHKTEGQLANALRHAHPVTPDHSLAPPYAVVAINPARQTDRFSPLFAFNRSILTSVNTRCGMCFCNCSVLPVRFYFFQFILRTQSFLFRMTVNLAAIRCHDTANARDLFILVRP